MARYRFYIDGELADLDQDGEEFDGDHAACISALRTFGEMLRDEQILLQAKSFSVRVADAEERSVILLTARATIGG